LILLIAAASPAAADEFQMRDGSRLEVQVLRDLGDRWDVRTLEGRRTIAKGDVRKHVERPGTTPWELFEKKFFHLVDKDDAGDNYALGLWAREEGMEAEARRAFERALRADPEHVKSRIALGHTRVDGKWVVPATVRKSPEDTGAPVGETMPGALEGVLKASLAKRQTDNFRLESTYLDQRALGRYLHSLERAREETLAFLGEAPPVAGRSTYFLVKNEKEYETVISELVEPLLARWEDRERAAAQMALFRRGHMAVIPGEPKRCIARRTDDTELADRAFLAHFAVHEVWSAETPVGRPAPDWLQEAVAYTVLGGLFPDDPTYCLSARGYGRTGKPPLAWRNTRAWPDRARTLVTSEKAIDFKDLAVLDLNSLSFDHLVQSWSVLDALKTKDASATRILLRRLRQGHDQFEVLKSAFKLEPQDVDRLWRAHVIRKR
jgi:hypothetical protein